jgi:hypothetical protein
MTAVVLGAILLPSLAMAQIDTRATFAVTKTFADTNTVDEVVVSIDCTTGTILDQDKDMSHGESVEFVVTAYTAGTMNCSIVENTPTPGYEVSYSGNGIEGSCIWEDIPNPFNGTCTVTNTPKPVEITVTKKWVIEGENNDVNLNYDLYANCSNVFDSQDQVFATYTSIGGAGAEGPGKQKFTFTVRPGFPNSVCYVDENVYDSAIEVNNKCRRLTVSAGKGASCNIVNTVFFEGIPTLSQYGMAIMALLMLGVGFVGFRRFV